MKSQKGFAHIFVLLLLIIGLAAGIYLITSGNPLKLFSKASADPITPVAGPNITKNGNTWETTNPTVEFELKSDLAPAH